MKKAKWSGLAALLLCLVLCGNAWAEADTSSWIEAWEELLFHTSNVTLEGTSFTGWGSVKPKPPMLVAFDDLDVVDDELVIERNRSNGFHLAAVVHRADAYICDLHTHTNLSLKFEHTRPFCA